MARKRTMATIGLAGMAGLSPAQVKPLPIPELPKVEVLPVIGPMPRGPQTPKVEIPVLPDPKPLPLPAIRDLAPSAPAAPSIVFPEVTKPNSTTESENRLRPAESGNNLNSGSLREMRTTPGREPVVATMPAAEPFTLIPHREEATMPLDRKSIFAAAIGAALSVNAAYADDKDKIPMATEAGKAAEKVEKPATPDLKKELDEVKAMLNQLTAKQQSITDSITGKGTDPALLKKVDDLATSLRSLEEIVRKLDEKIGKVNDNIEKIRTSFSSPLTKDLKTPEVAKEGIIKLVNQYGDSVTLILNGKPVRLAVGETKDVKVPIGTFEYALPLAGGEIKSSQVKDNEIVTLKIK
jgi:hypothetical protein